MTEEELVQAIFDILERGNHVADWPEDERNLHRYGDWASFSERHEAVQRLRVQKIIQLVRDEDSK